MIFSITLSNNLGDINISKESNILLTLHKFILFYGWGILVDIGIVFGRYFKTWKHYILIHSLVFFILDILTIIFESIMLN